MSRLEKVLYNEMSTFKCVQCGKNIKLNVVHRANHNGPYTCYPHGMLLKGKTQYQKKYSDGKSGYVFKTLKYIDKIRRG